MSDELDNTYCSCRIEGRGVELTPTGVYICLLCHNQIFVNKQWSPAVNTKRIKVLTNKHHALNEGYHGDLYEKTDN